METLQNFFSRTILVVGLICLLGGGCENNRQPKNETIPIVSKVDSIEIDYSRPPSYINPKNYRITFVNGFYIAKFPGGTEIDKFNTMEEAQSKINELAEESRKRWLEYGGY